MYKVYWTDKEGTIGADEFTAMADALFYSNDMRNMGYRFVTMASENPNSVGKPGVDSVVDGVLPNGDVYEWKMRR